MPVPFVSVIAFVSPIARSPFTLTSPVTLMPLCIVVAPTRVVVPPTWRIPASCAAPLIAASSTLMAFAMMLPEAATATGGYDTVLPAAVGTNWTFSAGGTPADDDDDESTEISHVPVVPAFILRPPVTSTPAPNCTGSSKAVAVLCETLVIVCTDSVLMSAVVAWSEVNAALPVQLRAPSTSTVCFATTSPAAVSVPVTVAASAVKPSRAANGPFAVTAPAEVSWPVFRSPSTRRPPLTWRFPVASTTSEVPWRKLTAETGDRRTARHTMTSAVTTRSHRRSQFTAVTRCHTVGRGTST